jgi:hypothetical protein
VELYLHSPYTFMTWREKNLPFQLTSDWVFIYCGYENGRIILKRISKRESVELCTGLIRFGVGINEVLFKHDNIHVGSINGEEFNV